MSVTPLPHTLDFSSSRLYDGPHGSHNRGAAVIHTYATARGIDPYATPRADLIAAIVADLDAAAT